MIPKFGISRFFTTASLASRRSFWASVNAANSSFRFGEPGAGRGALAGRSGERSSSMRVCECEYGICSSSRECAISVGTWKSYILHVHDNDTLQVTDGLTEIAASVLNSVYMMRLISSVQRLVSDRISLATETLLTDSKREALYGLKNRQTEESVRLRKSNCG